LIHKAGGIDVGKQKKRLKFYIIKKENKAQRTTSYKFYWGGIADFKCFLLI